MHTHSSQGLTHNADTSDDDEVEDDLAFALAMSLQQQTPKPIPTHKADARNNGHVDKDMCAKLPAEPNVKPGNVSLRNGSSSTAAKDSTAKACAISCENSRRLPVVDVFFFTWFAAQKRVTYCPQITPSLPGLLQEPSPSTAGSVQQQTPTPTAEVDARDNGGVDKVGCVKLLAEPNVKTSIVPVHDGSLSTVAKACVISCGNNAIILFDAYVV